MKYLMVFTASLLFGIVPSVQTNVMHAGVTPFALVVVDNTFACIFSVLYCVIGKIPMKISWKQLAETAVIGMFGLGITDIFLEFSYLHIPVGMATMLHFLFPAIVTVMLAVFWKEEMNMKKAGAVILSVVGMVFLTGGRVSGDMKGILFALLTAVSYAFYMIATEKGEIRKLHPMIRGLYTNFFAMVLALLFLPSGRNVFPSQAGQWGQCMLIGLMLCMGVMLLNMGIKEMGAGSASLLNMFEPVTSLVISTIAFQVSLSAGSLSGCVLICMSLVMTAWSDQKKTDPQTAPKFKNEAGKQTDNSRAAV